MVKKIVLLSSVLFILLLSGMTSRAWADVAAQFKQAETYEKQGQYEQAEQIYQQIVTDSPGTDDALSAQVKLTILYVGWDKQPDAEIALQELIGSFSQHKEAPAAVTYVADAYRKSQRHEKACELYNYVIGTWPQDEHALWSQMDLVISNTCLGNDSAATAAYEKLISQYSGHKLIPKAVCEIADNYRKLKKHQTAKELYQYVLANQPDIEVALWSQMGLAISNIQLSEDTAAQESTHKLLSDFTEYEQIPIAVCLLADEYRKAKKYENASVLYQYVVDNWPEAEHALWSQMNIAISNILLGDDAAAQETADKLLFDFAGDERLEVAGCLLADEYRKSNKHENSSVLYQYVIDNWPGTEYAMWSQMGLAMSNIVLGDDLKADAAIGKLLTDFPDQNGIQKAISSIAEQYRLLNIYDKAEQVYQSAIEALNKRPESDHAIWSQVAEIVSDVALGNEAIAQAALDKMIVDFNDHPDLPLALWEAASAYYSQAFLCINGGLDAKAKEYFAKVISLGERIRNQLPASTNTAEAYYFSGVCYERLGKYQKVIECYQKVIDNWPEYNSAWTAQFRIVKIYKKLFITGAISDSEANAAIKVAFEHLVESFPDSPVAEAARNWLDRNPETKEGE